jgi:hypothetical protein
MRPRPSRTNDKEFPAWGTVRDVYGDVEIVYSEGEEVRRKKAKPNMVLRLFQGVTTAVDGSISIRLPDGNILYVPSQSSVVVH